MRALSTDDMVAMIPADNSVIVRALLQIDPTFDLTKLTIDGTFKTAQIENNGEPAFMLWFRQVQNHLIIEMVVGLQRIGLDAMIEGFGVLARKLGCDFVDGTTKSKALADRYLKWGFTPIGVTFRGEVKAYG